MKRITVRVIDRPYDIVIGRGLLGCTCKLIRKLKLGNTPIIITNPKIYKLIGSKLKSILTKSGFQGVKPYIIADSEKSKSLNTAIGAIKSLVQLKKFSNPFIVALGGGVVGDLAGFVAAVYKRGIPYINIPTTLLAQVDSSVGGKVAVDLVEAKNLVGSFYQPSLVIVDPLLLKSLAKRDIRSGIAEIVKYGMIYNKSFFDYLREDYRNILRLAPKSIEKVIYESLTIKARVVEEDEKETKGFRTILNFGHTVGHALESAVDYSKAYSHGEAVAFGMVCAAEISEKAGLCKKTVVDELELLLESFGLPTYIKGVDINKLMNSLKLDKKFIHGKTRLVLPIKIGKVAVVEDVPLKIIRDVVKNRSFQ